jgi:predicted protein tyrosine phosphatase
MQKSPLNKDVMNALAGLKTAAHYLHETGDVESERLDLAFRDIMDAKSLIEAFLEETRNENKS